jgi:hypothetical protein
MPNVNGLGPALLRTMVSIGCRDADKVWDGEENIAGFVTSNLDGSVLTLDYEAFDDFEEPIHESTSVSFVEMDALLSALVKIGVVGTNAADGGRSWWSGRLTEALKAEEV